MLADDMLGVVERARARAVREASQVAFGVVTATSPLTVRLNGDTSGIVVAAKLDAYTPVTNDEVVLVRAGTDWICVGDFG